MENQENVVPQAQQEKPRLTIQQILADLDRGVTRFTNDKHYNPELGSIQQNYGLTQAEVKIYFSHAKLKGKKVKHEKAKRERNLKYQLIDEDETVVESEVNQVEVEPVTEEVPHVEMEEVQVEERQVEKVEDNTPEAEVVEETKPKGFTGF